MPITRDYIYILNVHKVVVPITRLYTHNQCLFLTKRLYTYCAYRQRIYTYKPMSRTWEGCCTFQRAYTHIPNVKAAVTLTIRISTLLLLSEYFLFYIALMAYIFISFIAKKVHVKIHSVG